MLLVWTEECFQMLEEGSLNLPAPEPLPGRSVPTPYVIIGDDLFTL